MWGKRRHRLRFPSFAEDCSGRVVWSKLSMASLCRQWLKNMNGGPSLIGLNGVPVETVCSLDFAQSKLQVLGTW